MFRPTGLTLRAAPPKERDHLLDGAATPPLPRSIQSCPAGQRQNTQETAPYGPLIYQLADRDIFQGQALGFKEGDIVRACSPGFPAGCEVSELDEVFPVTPAAFNHDKKLAHFFLRLLDGIDNDAVGAQYRLIIDLATKQHVATRGVNVLTGMHPFAFEYRLAAVRHCGDNLAGAYGLFSRARRHKPGFDTRLHFGDECFAALPLAIYHPPPVPVAGGVHRKQLTLGLPSGAE